MSGFSRDQQGLRCDGVALDAIAREVGTPVHVYSAAAIDERYRALEAAFAGEPHRLHYALKANSTMAIARRLQALGAGADANSGGELEVALRAGFAPADIVFTGVGKTRAELARAIAVGVGALNIESAGEAARIAEIARAAGARARVAVRVNPDIDAGSHPHISTGLGVTKFGVSVAVAAEIVTSLAGNPHVHVVGLHVHVGSQITTAEPLRRAAGVVAALARHLEGAGIDLDYIDLGGGLGVAYEPGQHVLSPAQYADAILPAVRETGLRVVLEPGRWLLGPAGVLLTEVVDLKRRASSAGSTGSAPHDEAGWFVVVDAGMTDLMRPALYGAWHQIEPVHERPGAAIRADIVGPVCETSDTLGRDRRLSPVAVGDLLAIRDTGAYGSVMASNYNRRPVAAEVLVESGAWRVIRRRQTVDDMLQWDV